jgi:hypothetical protein
MRRILAVVLMATLFVVGLAVPAFAEELGPSACTEQQPGQFISFVAQEEGHSGELNPGNAMNEEPPFVPFVSNPFHEACNPNA